MSRKSQIAVIGMRIFGLGTARALMQAGISVCAIDRDEAIIEAIKDQVTTALILDTTREEGLREAEINTMDAVVVAIGDGDVQSSILTTALLKQLGVRLIISRAVNALHARILKQVGADLVVTPEQDSGARLAQRLAHPAILDFIPLPDHYCIAKLPAPQPFFGHSLSQLHVRKTYDITVLGIERPRDPKSTGAQTELLAGFQLTVDRDSRIILDIDPEKELFLPGDRLLVMGSETAVTALTEL